MILIYCYDCEQVKYSFPRNLSCLSCGSQLVDEIPPVYSQDEEEAELEGEEGEIEFEEEAESVLDRLANTLQNSSVNFHFIPRRSPLSMEEVKFRQWVMRHLLWNGDMTQMPIEILSSPLLSQFTTTEEQEASYIFRNWVMRQVLLPQQQEDNSATFVQWIKKHILKDRTELDYRRKMRQALSFPLLEITQQETSAYRTRVFRVLGEQPQNQSNRPQHHFNAFSGFERGFHIQNPEEEEDIDDDDDDDDQLDTFNDEVDDYEDDSNESDESDEEDDESDDLNTSEEELLDDVGYFTDIDEFNGLSDTSVTSDLTHLLTGSSYTTLDFLYNFFTDERDADDSASVDLSVLDDLISEIRTRTTGTSRREQQTQSAGQIIQNLTEKTLKQNDSEYETECSICQEIFGKERLYILPCKHLYHSECISQWIRVKPTCPVCRHALSASSSSPSSSGTLSNQDLLTTEMDQQQRLHNEEDSEDDDSEESDQGEDDDEEETDDEEEEVDTHIQHILDNWPTDLWTDEDEEEDDDLSLPTHYNHLLLSDSHRRRTNNQRSRDSINSRNAIINGGHDDTIDHLWQSSFLHTTDLSPFAVGLNQHNWNGLIPLSGRRETNDSNIHWSEFTSDHHNYYNNDLRRTVVGNFHHYDQDQQQYASDIMDIE